MGEEVFSSPFFYENIYNVEGVVRLEKIMGPYRSTDKQSLTEKELVDKLAACKWKRTITGKYKTTLNGVMKN